jgi:8-oxo-dGTP pyrophosphatase MutT (NUDIX family)
MKRGTIQFAALPWRIGQDGGFQVMLLTSRETRRWVIPKGWPIKRRKPVDVAAQEAYEEAGLRGHIVGKRPVGSFHYEKRLENGAVLCEVQVFLFHVEHQIDDWPEKHQRVTQWFDAAEAPSRVDEKGLANIIRRLQNYLLLHDLTKGESSKLHKPHYGKRVWLSTLGADFILRPYNSGL